MEIKDFPDEDLVRSIQTLEETEKKELYFEIIVDRYKNNLFNLIYNYIKNYGTEIEAEELLLQTFSNFWFSIKNFKFKSKVYTYLYRVALNLCTNYIKQKSKMFKNIVSMSETNLEKELQEKPDLDIKNLSDDYKLLNLAINSLSINQRNALILSYYDNKSYQEIAEILNTTVSSVESLLFRAKQNIKKFILKNKELLDKFKNE